MKTYVAISVLAISVTSANVCSVFGAGNLRWLDGFTGGGGPWRAALVSGDGKVVVADGPTGPRRWTAEEGYVDLGNLPGFQHTMPMALSADGSVIVGRSYGDRPYAFIWTEAGGMQALPPLPNGPDIATAYGVSADGSIVVGISGYDYAGEAVVWSEGTVRGLGSLSSASPHSRAMAVSGNGTTVVGTTEVLVGGVSGPGAFRRTPEEGMLAIPNLLGGLRDGDAMAVSFDGSVIVGRSGTDAGTGAFGGRSEGEAFRWTKETGMLGLGDLPGGGFRSEALAVSADGSVIVGWSEVDVVPDGPFGDYRHIEGAFIWTEEHGMRSVKQIAEFDLGLDVTGWNLRFATGVSGDGTVVVGTGSGPSGSGVWVLTVPEPPTLGLVTLGFCCLAVCRLRKRVRHRSETEPK